MLINSFPRNALVFFLLWLPPQLVADELSGPTLDGKYEIALQQPDGGVRLNKVQSWIVTVLSAQGDPITPRSLVFLGGMPGHGHGLSSQPRVTQQLAPGRYLIEGVLLNMYGDWEIVIGVIGESGPDKVTFPFEFTPPRAEATDVGRWDAQQLALMRSLWLGSVQEVPLDASNRFDGNEAAIRLGEKLFNDPGLSRDANIACVTCHNPQLAYTDALPTSMGSKRLSRNSPSVQGLAGAKWFYWDGRRDSLWAQALTPIETPGEMDNNRGAVVAYVLSNDEYLASLRKLNLDASIVNDLPKSAGPYGDEKAKRAWAELDAASRDEMNKHFADIGKILASYVASIEPPYSRFDSYVERVIAGEDVDGILTESELRGLELYIDPANTHCMRCHNGPYFSSFGFHNIGTGVNSESGTKDFGRLFGLRSARVDEFNCIGSYSDLDADECRDLIYASEGHADDGAFKVPGLRDVGLTAPYFHDGRFDTLLTVLEFYRTPPDPEIGGSELQPLNLSDADLRDLALFLESLSADGEVSPK